MLLPRRLQTLCLAKTARIYKAARVFRSNKIPPPSKRRESHQNSKLETRNSKLRPDLGDACFINFLNLLNFRKMKEKTKKNKLQNKDTRNILKHIYFVCVSAAYVGVCVWLCGCVVRVWLQVSVRVCFCGCRRGVRVCGRVCVGLGVAFSFTVCFPFFLPFFKNSKSLKSFLKIESQNSGGSF